MKKIFSFFPPALILLLLGFFAYYSWHYQLLADDFEFKNVVAKRNFVDASISFYKEFNGRFAAHFFLCGIFELFSGKENYFFVYQFTMLSLFVSALAIMLRNYLTFFRGRTISIMEAFGGSLFITAFFFFFFFDGKTETWFWVSATGVYLISLILALTGFAIIFSKMRLWGKLILTLPLFFLAGGFSESFAAMYLLVLILTLIYELRKKSALKKNSSEKTILPLFVAIAGITAGLLLNILSAGTYNRLDMVPDFNLLQALKNTVHSLAMPFLRWEYLPVKAALVILLLLLSQSEFGKLKISWKLFLKKSIFVFLFIALSFFIPCYLLSDIVPDRAASLGYLAGVLFLFDEFIFSKTVNTLIQTE